MFLVEAIYITFLIYVKDIYGERMKEINFSTLATPCLILPDHCSYDPGPDFILRGQMPSFLAGLSRVGRILVINRAVHSSS